MAKGGDDAPETKKKSTAGSPKDAKDAEKGGSPKDAKDAKGAETGGGLGGLRGFWGRRSKRAKRRLIFYPSLVAIVVGFLCFTMIMPGKSYRGALPAADDETRRLAILLKRDVTYLAGEVGERNMAKKGSLDRTWVRLEGELADASYNPKSHRYLVDDHAVANVEGVREGGSRSNEVVVIGAHFDSALGAPGADDNATGVAVMLALARAFGEGKQPAARTIRFVAFVNEEPPHFWNPSMGSLHYAKDCKARGDNIVAMLSLESLGYYRDEPGSQKYPPIISWFYPDRANFVAFVGNLSSRSLTHDSIRAFRKAASFPSEGAAMPSWVTGVGWSDQWSFWEMGYPGVMVTDTAPFRNPNYHTAKDTPDTIDYERLARVTAGLISVVGALANP
jgi:hypothetical protein